ncbi:AMP-binding protein [Antrihabitans cavernicola]|uniref:AMP-binding protein n=1 Tax=Antrihabitans cavernicola TaxID=2495913 RepID=UPI001659175A|nr:AMP-binding protein [Spelaeibacter cavernicola]
MRSSGVRSGSAVVVHLDRGVSAFVAFLALMTMDAVYVPIDTDYPDSRKALILGEVKPVGVLSDSPIGDYNRRSEGAIHTVYLRGSTPVTGSEAARPPGYILYTSGTTGRPKGVYVRLAAVMLVIDAALRRHQNAELSYQRVLQYSSLGFDASIFEILMSFCSGQTLVACRERGNLRDVLKRFDVDFALLTPSTIKLLSPDNSYSLRQLVAGGEAMSANVVSTWAGRVALFNAYGPTEAAIMTHCVRLDSGSAASLIGPVIEPSSQRIVTESGEEAEIGEVGELIILGDQVADGYLDRPDATDRAFGRSSDGQRMYRTGDLMRVVGAGILEYVGRKDDQIKVNGVRVEIVEVEGAFESISPISSCVVAPKSATFGNGLCAHIELLTGHTIDLDSLYESVRRLLPGPIVPTRVCLHSVLPRLNSGKVDRRLLSADECGGTALVGSPGVLTSERTRNATEAQIADVWKKYLSLPSIPLRADYLTIGGNSLSIFSMLADIEHSTGVRVTAGEFYSAPTIEGLAMVCRSRVGPHARESMSGLRLPQFRCGDDLTKTLYCVHGRNGETFFLKEFSRLPGSYGVQGVRARGLDFDEKLPGSLEEMAAEYVDLILADQPEGPYFLAGFSAGGLLAFETAKQLTQGGADVLPVMLLDAEPPGFVEKSGDGEKRLSHLLATYSNDSRRMPCGSVEDVIAQLVELGAAAPDMSGEDIARRTRVLENIVECCGQYTTNPAALDAVLIVGEGLRSIGIEDCINGWRELVRRLDCVIVQTSHRGEDLVCAPEVLAAIDRELDPRRADVN